MSDACRCPAHHNDCRTLTVMLERMRAADFAEPQPALLADLRKVLARIECHLTTEVMSSASHSPYRATLSMLEVAVRAVAGADSSELARANADLLIASFAKLVAEDLPFGSAHQLG